MNGEVLSEIELCGELVRLRPPRVEDAERAYRLIAGRREILDWLEWAGPQSAEDLREQARHWRKESAGVANYQLAILRVPRESGAEEELAGALSLRFIDHPGRGDLGYWVAPEHQGRGLASEAVGLAVWLAFEVLEAECASACVFTGNHASRRVLEKHGFALQNEACALSSAPRPRWDFRLERASWTAREKTRPLEFHFAFTRALP